MIVENIKIYKNRKVYLETHEIELDKCGMPIVVNIISSVEIKSKIEDLEARILDLENK